MFESFDDARLQTQHVRASGGPTQVQPHMRIHVTLYHDMPYSLAASELTWHAPYRLPLSPRQRPTMQQWLPAPCMLLRLTAAH